MFSLLLAVAMAAPVPEKGKPADTRCFEIRTYWSPSGKLDALLSRFRDHTTKLFKKHGISNVAYWTPVENPENKLVYILAYPDKAARKTAWDAFVKDPDWNTAKEASEKNGKIVEKVEATLLESTDYGPKVRSGGKKPRVFELRTYQIAPGKTEALHARFRDHTLGLIRKHGGNVIGFWTPMAGEKGAGESLVYVVAYKDAEARQKAAEAFGKDPDWLKAKAKSEKDGKLVEKADSVLLSPTDFSPLK